MIQPFIESVARNNSGIKTCERKICSYKMTQMLTVPGEFAIRL